MRSTISLADRIRGLAAERHLTQEDLGKIFGVTRAAVRRRLRGQTDFTASDLQKLAQSFDIPIGALFGETKTSPADDQTTEAGRPPFPASVLTPAGAGAELGSSAPRDQAGATGDGA